MMTTKAYRIRQARELKGMTQTELAKRVGCSQAAIAHYESGERDPDAHLGAIGLATGFPMAHFNGEPRVSLSMGSLMFRGRKMTAREVVKAHRTAEIMFEVASSLRQHVTTYPVRIPRLRASPVEAARMTRAALGISPDRPIPKLVNALERAGVVVLALPPTVDDPESREPKWDAFSVWDDTFETPAVFVMTNRPADRINFSLAHELGHLVLHHPACGSRAEIESEAHAFAGEFLLPEVAMQHELVTPVTLPTLARLKPRWRVSIQMLIRRARDLGIIGDSQWDYLVKQIGAQGWRTREPEQFDFPVEKPRALRKMAEILYGTPVDTRRLAKDLNLLPGVVAPLLAAHAEAKVGATTPTRAPARVIALSSARKRPTDDDVDEA